MTQSDRHHAQERGHDPAATPSPSAPQIPRRIRWLMNTLGTFALIWTAYCIYAWATHSGIWQMTWNTIASHQRGTPDSRSVAMISWGIGLGPMLVVGWPTLQLLRRQASRR
jgi:hypothetical protein